MSDKKITLKQFKEYQIKYIEQIVWKASNLHKLGNIRLSGDQIEEGVKYLLRQFIPERFGITSGHIIAKYKDGKEFISSHFDIIIYDKLVPHREAIIDEKNEIVSINSVAGIIEVKKQLTKKALEDAIKKLGGFEKELDIQNSYFTKYLVGGVGVSGNGGIKIQVPTGNNYFKGVVSLSNPKKMPKVWIDLSGNPVLKYHFIASLGNSPFFLCPMVKQTATQRNFLTPGKCNQNFESSGLTNPFNETFSLFQTYLLSSLQEFAGGFNSKI